MKKVYLIIIAILSFAICNKTVNAASASLGVSTGSVYTGDSFTVSVNVSAAAAWNVHVSASGPVSGCAIHQADASADAMNTNRTFSAGCTATGPGTITITLSGDVSSQEGATVGASGSRTVSVQNRPTPAPAPAPTPSGPTNPSTNNTPANNNPADTRSNNANLKELKVEGYALKEEDKNIYTLSVPNDVTSINIKATPDDSKAKVTGTGDHALIIGDNIFEIVVTAENGTQNKIYVKVKRKDGYYLEDIDSALKKDDSKGISININSDTVLKSDILDKVKQSNKKVSFNYYDNDKKLVYSWIIDGSKLKNNSDLDTVIEYNSEYKKDIQKLSNYSEGIYISLKQKSNLPNKAKIRVYVGDKYNNGDKLNVYSYVDGNDKLTLINKGVKVEDGYLIMDVVESSNYLLTMATIQDSEEALVTDDTSISPLIFIIAAVAGISLIGLVLVLIKKKKTTPKQEKKTESEPTVINNTAIDSNRTQQTPPIEKKQLRY